MTLFLRLTSYLGLAITCLSPLLLWAGKIDTSTNTSLLILGMFLWFGTAVFWIKPDQHEA